MIEMFSLFLKEFLIVAKNLCQQVLTYFLIMIMLDLLGDGMMVNLGALI